jgi:hypothetical protein
MRATPNRQTGFSANFFMFGREVTQPIDLTFGLLTIHTQEKETFDFVQDLITTPNLVHDVARDNLKSAQQRQKKDSDLRASCKAYYVGDAVYKLDSATKIGQSRKLKTPWKGPYTWFEIIGCPCRAKFDTGK